MDLHVYELLHFIDSKISNGHIDAIDIHGTQHAGNTSSLKKFIYFLALSCLQMSIIPACFRLFAGTPKAKEVINNNSRYSR